MPLVRRSSDRLSDCLNVRMFDCLLELGSILYQFLCCVVVASFNRLLTGEYGVNLKLELPCWILLHYSRARRHKLVFFFPLAASSLSNAEVLLAKFDADFPCRSTYR